MEPLNPDATLSDTIEKVNQVVELLNQYRENEIKMLEAMNEHLIMQMRGLQLLSVQSHPNGGARGDQG